MGLLRKRGLIMSSSIAYALPHLEDVFEIDIGCRSSVSSEVAKSGSRIEIHQSGSFDSFSIRKLNIQSEMNYPGIGEHFLGGETEVLRNKVSSLVETCSEADWDGKGAYAVTEGAKKVAFEVLDRLESGFRRPKIDPTDLGSILFSWEGADDCSVFDLYCTRDGKVVYVIDAQHCFVKGDSEGGDVGQILGLLSFGIRLIESIPEE